MNVSLPKKMHAVQLLGHGGLDKLYYRDDVNLPEWVRMMFWFARLQLVSIILT